MALNERPRYVYVKFSKSAIIGKLERDGTYVALGGRLPHKLARILLTELEKVDASKDDNVVLQTRTLANKTNA